MSAKTSNILLWMFVINLGISFGAGLYEARIELPQWLVSLPDGGYEWDAEAARDANTGLRFWVFASTISLTLLAPLNLIAAWRSASPLRSWWLAAASIIICERAFTLAYFIPTMVTLMQAELSQEDAIQTAIQWISLNHLRHLLVLTGWLAALKAFKGHDVNEANIKI